MNDNVLGNQIGFAVGISALIELLKRSPFPWFTQHSDQLNRFASLLAAAATAIGLTMTVQGSILSGGQITIVFPSLAVILQALLRFSGQAGMQEMFYRTVLKPKPS